MGKLVHEAIKDLLTNPAYKNKLCRLEETTPDTTSFYYLDKGGFLIDEDGDDVMPSFTDPDSTWRVVPIPRDAVSSKLDALEAKLSKLKRAKAPHSVVAELEELLQSVRVEWEKTQNEERPCEEDGLTKIRRTRGLYIPRTVAKK
jgi:hypothetical protein